jgi:hypothetical protein
MATSFFFLFLFLQKPNHQFIIRVTAQESHTTFLQENYVAHHWPHNMGLQDFLLFARTQQLILPGDFTFSDEV